MEVKIEGMAYVRPSDVGESGKSSEALVAEKILTELGLSGEEIDMIVFSSHAIESIERVGALKVHRAIRGKGEAICYDFNANCAGLIEACNHVCRCMMQDDTIKKALIVGMDYNSAQCGQEGTEVGTLADTACAMVLKVCD